MTSSAVGGPLRVTAALVTTVVACTIASSTSAGAIPAFASTPSTAAKNPSSRSPCVVSRLSDRTVPSPRRSTASVNVPPISTAMR